MIIQSTAGRFDPKVFVNCIQLTKTFGSIRPAADLIIIQLCLAQESLIRGFFRYINAAYIFLYISIVFSASQKSVHYILFQLQILHVLSSPDLPSLGILRHLKSSQRLYLKYWVSRFLFRSCTASCFLFYLFLPYICMLLPLSYSVSPQEHPCVPHYIEAYILPSHSCLTSGLRTPPHMQTFPVTFPLFSIYIARLISSVISSPNSSLLPLHHVLYTYLSPFTF